MYCKFSTSNCIIDRLLFLFFFISLHMTMCLRSLTTRNQLHPIKHIIYCTMNYHKRFLKPPALILHAYLLSFDPPIAGIVLCSPIHAPCNQNFNSKDTW
jgi:hypothetical protein